MELSSIVALIVGLASIIAIVNAGFAFAMRALLQKHESNIGVRIDDIKNWTEKELERLDKRLTHLEHEAVKREDFVIAVAQTARKMDSIWNVISKLTRKDI